MKRSNSTEDKESEAVGVANNDDTGKKFKSSRTNLLNLGTAIKNEIPFNHWMIDEFVDSSMIDVIQTEMLEMKFYEKRNDLYDFMQSSELGSVINEKEYPVLSQFCNELYGTSMQQWIRQTTDIQVNNRIDFFASIYSQGNFLLCHDDRMETRRVAFIWYLVDEDWSKEDGGELSLMKCDRKDVPYPTEIVKQLVPKRNRLAFFEVSDESFHMVSEVLSQEKMRLAISGWFHAPAKREYASPKVMPSAEEHFFQEHAVLSDWIKKDYLDPTIQNEIASAFTETSSIELGDFLLEEKYNLLLSELESCKQTTPKGPLNFRNYHVLPITIFETLKSFHSLIHSHEFLELVEKFTQTSYQSISSEMCKFSAGSYSLMHDSDPERQLSGLDLWFCAFRQTNWDPEQCGGSIHYFDTSEPNDDDSQSMDSDNSELLTVDPQSNTLSLVLRCGPGTSSFVRYVNHRANSPLYLYKSVFRLSPEPEEE